MKIGFKLTVIMITLNLFSIAAVGITLLLRSETEIGSLANTYALASARESAADLGKFLAAYWYKAETAAEMMEQYENIFVNNRRIFFNNALYTLVEENPDILGVWCIWDNNALEGNDQRYLGTVGANETGRFTPYWYRTPSGIMQEVLDEDEVANPQGPYQTIKRRDRGAVLDPYSYKIEGKETLMTTMALPIHSRSGRITGIIGIDITLEKIQEISKINKPFDSDIFAVFSNNGTIVSHFDSGRIGRDMRETERDMAGHHFDSFMDAINMGKEFSYSIYVGDLGANLNVFSVPIKIGTSQTPWNYAVAITSKIIMAPVRKMEILTVIIGIVILAMAALAAVFLSRSLSKPIVKVTDALKDISHGEGDLTRSIAVNSKDEIGSMAHYFNLTLEKIKNLVKNIKSETTTLSDIGTELAGNMTETAAAVNEITANIQSIKGRVINQSVSVSQTNTAMEHITVNIDKLNEHVEEQSSNIERSSSAIEEMLANIQSVTSTLINNADNVRVLMEASESGRTGLQEVSTDIKEIARQSEGLLQINGVMENIASQTNLLSMNAAIEAAHAGESGKGFAVVADEIRKLAEDSSEQSRIIGGVLKKIKDSIFKITLSTNNVFTIFEAINSSVRIVADQQENIRSAMEEQDQGSKQILEAISYVNESTRQVRDGSMEMLAGSREVIQESKNLEKATEEITGGMNEMACGADQINVAVNRVNELSGKNREKIQLLMEEVSRFKV
jgi:methyl-accepting chemotaxis protein